jgi:hypothetical protein
MGFDRMSQSQETPVLRGQMKPPAKDEEQLVPWIITPLEQLCRSADEIIV